MFYVIRYYYYMSSVWNLAHAQYSNIEAACEAIKRIESREDETFISMKKVG